MLDAVEVMTDWNDEGQRLIEGWKLEEEEQREDLGNSYRGQRVSCFERRGCNGWFVLAPRQNLKGQVLHRWCSGVIFMRSPVLREDLRVLCSHFLFEKTQVHLLMSGLVWGRYYAGQVLRLWCDTWPDFTDWRVERWCVMVIYHPECNINFITPVFRGSLLDNHECICCRQQLIMMTDTGRRTDLPGWGGGGHSYTTWKVVNQWCAQPGIQNVSSIRFVYLHGRMEENRPRHPGQL